MTEKSIKQQQHEKRVEINQKLKFLVKNLEALDLEELENLKQDLSNSTKIIVDKISL